MKLNQYPAVTENESISITDRNSSDEKAEILENVLSKPLGSSKNATKSSHNEAKSDGTIEGVVIGIVKSCDHSGAVTVDYPGSPSKKPLIAATLNTFGVDDIEKEVALMFEAGNPRRPIIMGRIQHLTDRVDDQLEEMRNLQIDGNRMTFRADREIVLRCGQSSITLTRAGKVIIRGEYLLSRSTGTNRIKGGSVQIN